MLIRTTANIDKKILYRLREAAELCGISVHQIVFILLKILIKEKPLKFRLDCAVKYQSRRKKDRWRCIHIEMTQAVYESCIDLRKLMKFSVSYLLSYAVEVYLDRVVEEIMNCEAEYNYPAVYYIFTSNSPNKFTFTVFHTVPTPEEFTDYFNSSG